MNLVRDGSRLTLKGRYFIAHREEILDFVAANVARAQRGIAPRCDIRSQEDSGDVCVTIEDARRACALGLALQAAFAGDLDFDFRQGRRDFRATWSR